MGYLRYRVFPEGEYRPVFHMEVRDALGHLMASSNESRLDVSNLREMTDYVGHPKSYNPILHRTCYFNRTLARTISTRTGFGVDGWSLTMSPYLIPKQVTWQEIDSKFTFGVGQGFTSSTFQTFVNDAFFEITDSVARELDLYNIARDLVTLKGLFSQIKSIGFKLFHLVQEVYRRLGRSFRNFTFSELRTLVREGSNAFLLNEFGILPLMREVEDAITRVGNVKKRLEFLRRTAGRTFPAHFSRSVTLPHVDTYWYTDNRIWSSQIKFVNPKETVKYVASAVIKNTLSVGELDGILGEVTALWGGLGLNRGAEFLWDLVPFSFVLNWFFRVDKWIRNNLTPDMTWSSLRVLEGGCSYKSTFTAQIVACQPWFDPPQFPLGTVNVKYYARVPGFGCDYSIWSQFGGLNSTQQAIAAALVGQRVA